MEPLSVFGLFCVAMSQLWIATGENSIKFRVLITLMWTIGAIAATLMLMFK